MINLSKRRDALIILAVSVFLLWLSWRFISTLAFITSDTGLRLLQIKSLIASEWHSFAVPYPARFVDPELRHAPYYDIHLIIDNALYLPLSPYFTLFSSWLYQGLGRVGLTIIPPLGGIFTALSVYGLVRLVRLPHPLLAFLATLFATPLLFYTLTLWDHTLGAALVLGGLYGVAAGMYRGRLWPVLLGGISLGLSVGQRPELHLFALAVGLALLLVYGWQWKAVSSLAAGGLLGAFPIWLTQYWWFGHPLAPIVASTLLGYGKLTGSSSVQTGGFFLWLKNISSLLYVDFTIVWIRKGLLLLYVDPRYPFTFIATLLVLLGMMVLLLGLRAPRWRRPSVLGIAFGLLSVGYAIFVWIAGEHIVSGLLSTFPLLILGMTIAQSPSSLQGDQSDRAKVDRLMIYVNFLFLGLMLVLWPAFGGLQWGARYLLPVYPLFIYLVWRNYHLYRGQLTGLTRHIFQIGSALLLALSILLQVMGARQIYLLRQEYLQMMRTLEKVPAEVVLTNKRYFPSHMSATDKIFIYVRDEADLNLMLDRLRQAGIQQVIVLGLNSHTVAPSDLMMDLELRQLTE